ncbi:MAG: S53 family peptidase [Jatrophihabitantaceae bacterium]
MQTYNPNSDGRPLAGSERSAAPDAQIGRALAGRSALTITLLIRRRAGGGMGADPADLTTVTEALTAAGAQIVLADAPSRRVQATGTVELLSAMFGTQLEQTSSRAPDGSTVTHRHRTGGLTVPGVLDGIVTAVLGLDDRPQARAQFRIAQASAVVQSYTPLELGAIYRFPPVPGGPPACGGGSGQQIAIIELGGGYETADLDTYFAGLGITGPTVTAVGVDGAANQPGQDPQGADGEVLLDIEVAGALAPNAEIVVYFAPNTDAGFLNAVSDAVHARSTPAAISISWGQSEDTWTAQARTALDSVFADAVTLGITVTAAAGDNGSTDAATDGRNHADFPASSPNVLACGGTSLSANPSSGVVTSETVWNDGTGGATGGGVSDAFATPDWQRSAGVPGTGRGVPDVAAVADPRTGYQVLVDGTAMVIGGTSAVAPLWAALVARLRQAVSAHASSEPAASPSLMQVLYQGVTAGRPAAGFRDIVTGNNGAYAAATGWDACTGLGAPDGTALLALLAGSVPPAVTTDTR